MMNAQPGISTFVQTTEYDRFADVCDASRQYRSVVFCLGASGVGKTTAARHYAHWNVVGTLVSESGMVPPPDGSPDRPVFRTALYTPLSRWQGVTFLPRLPRSLQELDGLLLRCEQTRMVHQEGIAFGNAWYMDVSLAGYVKEEVVIRYDPADLTKLAVSVQADPNTERFLCYAARQDPCEPRTAVLTLGELEQRFRTWLLEEYHRRVQKGQRKGPQERWEEGGFLPRMPESLEQLDLLLVQVARKRRVQQSGIAFEGSTYIDPTLAAYVGEEVQIRYDPLDLAEVRVYFEDRFVCRAICPELSGQTVSLKEIEAARRARRKHLRGELESRETLVKQYVKQSMRGGQAVELEAKAGKEPSQEEAADRRLAPQGDVEVRKASPRLRRYRDE